MTLHRSDGAPAEPVVKALDGPWAAYVVAPVAHALTRRLADTPVTPNQVTIVSFGLQLLAAWAASYGSFRSALATVVLLHASFLLDMVDGQLARARGAGTALGGFLDRFTDRLGEVVLYGGMAWGFVRATGDPSIWPLAYGAAVVLLVRQTANLLVTVEFGLSKKEEQALYENGLLTRALTRAGLDGERQRGRWVAVLKSFLWFGIGERFVMISIALLLGRPDVYFWVVLVVFAPTYAARFGQKLYRTLRR